MASLCVGNWWEKIRELAEVLDLVVDHVYRELNALADFMASQGLESSTDLLFLSDFPTRLEGLACLDRIEIPYVRIDQL
ncbi:hypothetical protein BVC80_1223g5 [Macleaya cordata]|uniref:RNase H type-1 domain-containing protein n=1 Tax=Macleaya cordata TaxID=56857 RepID=A0A200R8K8_MACCD|nr:hypothetical protein BVC80_1223g5 [Macleaya cordata]